MAEQLAGGPKETWETWLQAFSVFLIYAGTWGLLAVYGTFQNYYETVLLPHRSTNDISWVGTIAAILLIFGGVLTGPIYDQGWVRELLLIGSFLTILGIMMTSLATEYWHILLAQGLCLGLGSGILSNPAIALITSSFSGNRTLALGLATSGTAIAGIIYPIIMSRLFPAIGFRWATRVLGFIALAELIVALAIMLPYTRKSRQQQIEQKRSLSDLLDSAPFKDAGFMALSFAYFFMWIGYWAISFFIPTFATFKLGASNTESDDFLVIFNAISIVGRILAVIVSNKWGVPRMAPWFAIASGIMLLGWTGIHSITAFYVWVVLMTILLTPLAVLCPSMLAHVSPSKEVMGTRMGIAFGFTSIGVLVGTYVSSVLIDRETGSFWKMQVFCGITMIFGGALMAFVAREVARKATKPSEKEDEGVPHA
ncbi:putative monocarboxylate permease [Polychaeton citri CBS 116435]|uniref:Monocarboxylate permease n=1 Tax=Polychaeton citri CBS 116435 TaxID=1314669 RepID=A0A9P4QDF9_9PEZI|nr:putative monocarboxylate permease [Polychaeton citri CBS 116435]